ncbi:ubiquitin-conjugating enzyme/RWD-like protein [Tanacetum coccineum]
MDFLRAVIIGPPGTPYQNGLFFFDVCFPVNYPDSPPLLNYRSGGLGINPYLALVWQSSVEPSQNNWCGPGDDVGCWHFNCAATFERNGFNKALELDQSKVGGKLINVEEARPRDDNSGPRRTPSFGILCNWPRGSLVKLRTKVGIMWKEAGEKQSDSEARVVLFEDPK